MNMFRRPIKEIDAEFIAEEKYLESIQRTVREACVAAGMSRKDITAVQLAIEEGATNIIRHAYLYEKGTIRLRIVIYKKLIVFSLMDTGRSFEPDGVGRIDLKRLVASGRKGGLGFYMIQKIMDSVEYISAADYNELRMIKRFRPFHPDSRPLLRRLLTLRVKFSVWTFIIVTIIIGGSFYYIDRRTSRQLYEHLDDTVRSLATTVADQAAGYIINHRSDVEFDELIVSYLRANPELKLIVLTDSAGLVLAHSEDIRNIRKPYRLPRFVEVPKIERLFYHRDRERRLNYLALPIKVGERILGAVHVTYSTAQVGELLAQARMKTGILTLVLLLIGVLGIYLLSNYFVEPIVKITRRVRRFASGDLETELPLEGAEEFFEISKAFNEMITRLRRDQKNIVAREKLAKEIEVISQIQKALLPRRLPTVPGLEIDAFYRAASTVGGDLYDVFQINPERFCLTVADVSGKGVPASLVMSMLRTVIQIQAAGAVSAKETLVKVNNYLKENIPPGMFITVLLVIYNSTSREIKFVSAGHNPLLLYQAATGTVSRINPAGMPLGMPTTLGPSFEERLEEVSLVLEEGDAFFIYTDGITEATNRDGQQFGLDRLEELFSEEITKASSDEISSVSKTLVNRLDDFSGFAKPADDVTFIIARARVKSRTNQTEQSPDDDHDAVETRNLKETSPELPDPD
jgi:serine phosphatase RsbU (regulator of sigma subunit)/anti-sigma regulatory factor (Ser/Thr protein kinase)